MPAITLWLGLAAALVLLVALGAILLLRKPASPAANAQAEIGVAQAYERREAGAFLLDVRQPEEWEEYHVPGSTLIPLADLESRIGELPRDAEVVVVCRSGNRSKQGRDILLNAGFEEVTSMAGGLKEWKAAGYPTVTGP